jgi:hypothetical protein
VGQDQFGIVDKLVGRHASRIEQRLIPFQDRQLIRGRDTVGLDVIERNIEMVCTRRNIDVKRKYIQKVALPRDGFSIRLEFQPGQICNRSLRPVASGKPLWVVDCQGTRLDGNDQLGMQKLLRRLCGIDGD